jgi:hypothetical protein
MNKLFFKSFIVLGIIISSLYGVNNKEHLLEHGFIKELPDDPNVKNTSSEFNITPKPTGPYQVGVKVFDVVDENRDNRLIPIWVFFPLQKGEQKTYPKIIEERALDLWDTSTIWEILNINVHSKLVNNLESLKNTKHPVILFNHGNGMLCCDHAFLLEDLASHGYIVVSIQSQLNTDKLISPKFAGIENYNKVIRNNLYVFDWLQNNNKTIFYNSLDLSKMGVIGYSMGGNSLLLWADKVNRSRNPNNFLFPHNEISNVKECLVSLDARRIAFPLRNNIPIFMLISSQEEKKQKLNGEYELMQKIGHKFKYYKSTHHGSFSDGAYFNINCPLSPKKGWYYGSTKERIQFFNEIRRDIRKFLEENLEKK